MKKTVIFVLGCVVGILIGCIISTKINLSKPNYIELPANYVHKELGVLKKGTMLKYDKGFSEGFSRYILYINISDADNLTQKKSESYGEVIPYWIEREE